MRGRRLRHVDSVQASGGGSPDLRDAEQFCEFVEIPSREAEPARPDYKFVRVGPDWHKIATESGWQCELPERPAIGGMVVGLPEILPEDEKDETSEADGDYVTVRLFQALGPRSDQRPRGKLRRGI